MQNKSSGIGGREWSANVGGVLRQLLLLCVCVVLTTANVAQAQIGIPKNIPNEGYFLGFAPYNDGDFRSAQEIFREAGKAGYVSVDGRWIDAICFHTMVGECYYQMGDYRQAMEQYTNSVKLLISYNTWMTAVNFDSANIQPDINPKPIATWGVPQRRVVPGSFPQKIQTLTGRLDNSRQIQQGGVVAAPQLQSVYVSEIVRCSALAISRRRELLGPVCQHDPLTAQLLNATLGGMAPPNHWSQCWADLQIGLAYASAGKPAEAVSYLTKSLLAGGQYDHPLTCMALLELGKLAFDAGKLDVAGNFFLEASYSAAYFDRPSVLEEALRLGALAHVVGNQNGVYPPLVNATAWAKQKRYRILTVSLMVAAAEGMSTRGEGAAALAAVNLAKSTATRSDMMLGQVGARLNYEAARAQLMTGNIAPGNASLAAAMAYQKKSSRRLYQIALADSLSVSGVLTERVADRVYAETLREPTPADWLIDPMETLSVVSNPHILPYEHWLELALLRKEVDKAINIADRIRRHRFFATLPLGGRLLAIRWVLEAPKESLDEETLLQRQDIFAKYPQLSDLAAQSSKIQGELAGLPATGLSDEDSTKQKELLVELSKVATAQEVILQQLALRRLGATFVFPPLRNTKTIQENLRPGQLIFCYLQTSQRTHAFALSKENMAHFAMPAPGIVKKDVTDLLKLLGMHDRNQPIPAADLASDGWKTIATKLLPQLTNGTKANDWSKYEELIVVPDGVLWYLPFELLQVPQNEMTESLGGLVKVRYSPTVGLAIADGRPKKRVQKTAIVPGKMLTRDDESVSEEMAEQIHGAIEGSEVWKELPAQGALASSIVDRLIVLSDVEDADKQPYGWAPLGLDRGKPGNFLSDWFLMPFHSPEQIVLPGYHSAAEYGLKKGGTGEEIFLTLCGLMSTGTRSVMLSRWRVGGESTRELTREFVQELPHSRATEAWQRSLKLWKKRDVDVSSEPRIKAAEGKVISAEHPFFWAGYLIVDSEAGEVRMIKDAKPEELPEEELPMVGKGKDAAKPAAGEMEKEKDKGGKAKGKPANKGKVENIENPDELPEVMQNAEGGDEVIGNLLPEKGKGKPKAKAGKAK